MQITKRELSKMIQEELLRENPDHMLLQDRWENVNDAILVFVRTWYKIDRSEYLKYKSEIENLLRKIDTAILTRKV